MSSACDSDKDPQMKIDDGALADALPEWSAFNLSTATLKGIQSMGFIAPTKIQTAALPLALEKRLDILGAAETGSGKTMAFVIPIIERWLAAVACGEHEPGGLFALVITPTRELAVQIRKELERIAIHTAEPRLRSLLLCGGINQQKQERLLRKRPDVIVATPGRLWSLIELGDPHVDDLSSVRMLVVDEVDRMRERGHFQELSHIIARVHANINESLNDNEGAGDEDETAQTIADIDDRKVRPSAALQTLVFSATLTFAHAPVRRADGTSTARRSVAMKLGALVKFLKMRPERAVVDVTASTAGRPAGLVECRMHCADLTQKDANLYYLLNRYGGRTLVFTNSVDAAQRLYSLLGTLRFRPVPKMLHAKMLEQKRLKNLETFTETENAVLLATDVAARGLDIRGVQNVIHYQMPRTSELYVHRSGRTARAQCVGLSVLFIDPHDLQAYTRIRKNLEWKEDLELLTVDQPRLMDACRQRVEVAAKYEAAEFAHKKVSPFVERVLEELLVYTESQASSRNEWFKRLAEEADMILDEDLAEVNEENGGDESPYVHNLQLQRKALEKTLNSSLRQPLPVARPATADQGRSVPATISSEPTSTTTGKKTASTGKPSDAGSKKTPSASRVISGADVENLVSTEQLREWLRLEKKSIALLKRHFKKRKRIGGKKRR